MRTIPLALRKADLLGSTIRAAIRHIGHNKFASSINVLSLAIGLAAALAVMLFVRHELSYDSWIPDAEQIYRFETEILDSMGSSNFTPSAPAIARDVLLARYSEIEAATRISWNIHSLHMANKVYYENVMFADENFFEVLDLPLLEGDKATALAGVSSVLLSEEMAFKYFGEQSAMGQTLAVEEQAGGEIRDFKVTGVFRDIPVNSHLDLNFILTYQADDDEFDIVPGKGWSRFGYYTYLKLGKGARPERLEADFPALMDAQVDASRWGRDGQAGSEFLRPFLIALTDIHLDTRTADPLRPLGDRGLVLALLGIAFLILVIASINFMNLALARSMSRAREVSIRKVHGAGRRQLISQYLGETAILTLLALGLAVAVLSLGLPSLNTFVGKDLALATLFTGDLIIALFALLCFVAVLAGFYPAFVLSSFRPAAILRGVHGARGSGHRLRTTLVVFQFAVSIALGIGAAVVQTQRQYTANYDLGFSVDDKLVIRYMNWGHFAEKSQLINDRIRALPEVIGTAYSNVVPGDLTGDSLTMSRPGNEGKKEAQLRPFNVDAGFFDVYGVELVAGRFFSSSFGQDMLPDDAGDEVAANFSTILNESAVHRLGFESAEAALGVTLNINRHLLEPIVVGVVRDSHFSSLREEILPTTYYMQEKRFSNLTVQFRSGVDVDALVRDITAIWQDSIPQDPITLEYLDQNVAAHYAADRRQGIMVTGLAILALFIACIGLYGLSALTTAERSREISIRKVHGAPVHTIISLLLWRFSIPVLVANLFAWPLAWYAAREYLDQFSYRIDLGAGFFVGAGFAVLFIACMTVGGHALKVACTNPIHALRARE